MSDADLRALEREVAAHGTPDARLRYARALERAGRRDDALDALLPGVADPAVRRAVGAFPGWTSAEGAGWNTRTADVAPIRREPVVAWRRRLPASRLEDATLLATPLAVVVSGSGRGVLALAPLTGDLLWADAAPSPQASSEVAFSIRGDVLVGRSDERLSARDLATGAQLWSAAARAGAVPTAGPLALLGARSLRLVPWADPRFAPELQATAFELALPPRFANPTLAVAAAGGQAVVKAVRRRRAPASSVMLVDPAAGCVRWTASGFVAAADAVEAVLWREDRLALHDATGERWRGGAPDLRQVVLGVRRVAAAGFTGAAVHLLDRATGERVTVLDDLHAPRLAMARDVLYVEHARTLSASSEDGALLWRYPLGRELTSVSALAPLGRRLFVLGWAGAPTLLCLEEPR